MKMIIKIIVLIAIIASGWLLLKLSGLDTYFSFQALQNSKAQLLSWVEQNRAFAIALFLISNFIAISLSVPGAVLFTLSSGFLFGPFWGTLLVNLSATAGAFVVFFLTRKILGQSLQQKYAEKLQSFNASFQKDGTSYLLALRLMPIFPFFLINILAGLTTVKPLTFLWTTSVGIVAGSFVYSFAGSRLAEITSPSEILSLPVLFAFILLALFSLIPLLAKKITQLRTKSRLSREAKIHSKGLDKKELS